MGQRHEGKHEIIGTGLSGLVGSRVVELLSSSYSFTDLSWQSSVDIRDRRAVFKRIGESGASSVFHFAAKTDVDGCENESSKGKESEAWQINVVGTKHVAEACKLYNKQLLYISTDFVFDGDHAPYSETDIPHPINFYGRTKFEGEQVVLQTIENPIIVRISFPYRKSFDQKKDLIRSVAEKINAGEEQQAITDQYIVPTFIDDIAYSLELLIKQRESGIFHVVGSQAVTPYELFEKIGFSLRIGPRLVPVAREAYYQGRAKRPYKSILKNDKITRLGAHLLTVDEGLAKIFTS